MKTIAFLQMKGGVGKTQSSITIADMLATLHEKKVLLIDLDPQAHTSNFFSEIDYLDRLVKKFNDEIDYLDKSVGDLLLDAKMDIHEIITKTRREGIDLIRADFQLAGMETRLMADATTPQQFRLSAHLKKVQDEYDYCILDCGPSMGIVNINGLAAADEVYVPTRSDGYSLEGVSYALNLIETVQNYNLKLTVGGVFFTAWENFNCPKVAYEILNSMVGELLLPFKINKTKFLTENTMQQKTLLQVDKNFRSPATKAYKALTDYILSDDRRSFREDYEEKQEKLAKAKKGA